MFDGAYPYSGLGISSNITKQHLLKTYKFFFNTEEGVRYIINVEHYNNNIFILKFHPRKLKSNKYKYNIVTNTGHFSKIVRTNINVLIDFYKKYPNSHFGFIGAMTYCQIKKCYTESQSITSRFKLYKYAVENLINPDDFEHHFDEENNTYLLINLKCNNIDYIKDVSKIMFEDYMNY